MTAFDGMRVGDLRQFVWVTYRVVLLAAREDTAETGRVYRVYPADRRRPLRRWVRCVRVA